VDNSKEARRKEMSRTENKTDDAKAPSKTCWAETESTMTSNQRLAAALLIVTLTVGCSSGQPPTGKQVTVQFRRDALGSGGGMAIPPTTTVMNGANVSLSGQLREVHPEWVVLHDKGNDYWIQRESVLLILAKE